MAEQEKIQRYIIKSTPYGELIQVLKELDRVCPVDVKSQSMTAAIQQYNEEHLALVTTEHGNFPLMASNKVGQGKYVDQVHGKIYTVDHYKHEILNTQPHSGELMQQVQDLIVKLHKQAQVYLDQYYKAPNGVQVYADIAEGGMDIYLGLTSKNISLSKFYTGEWISKWKINKESIDGVVTIKAHFFEGGNVQFNQKRQIKQQFQFTANMGENATSIVEAIKKFQAAVQQSLNVTYDEMPNKFFKKLRRLAPYTKTKMAWNMNAIKMNHNLLQRKQ